MKLPALTREQVRQVDKTAIEQFGIPGIVLMENAGRGAAEIIHRVAPKGQISILCGKGNNAGDGYVIARHLELAGHDVRIVSITELASLAGDARVNAIIAQRANIDIHVAQSREEIGASLGGAATIVDGLLGTGARGPLRDLYADTVTVANSHAATRIAIDIPTGMDCDSGVAGDPTFRADHTITFVACKIGFENENANEFVGEIHEVGIGVPKKLIDDLLLRQP